MKFLHLILFSLFALNVNAQSTAITFNPVVNNGANYRLNKPADFLVNGTIVSTPASTTSNAFTATQGRVIIGGTMAIDITGAGVVPTFQIIGTDPFATQMLAATYSNDANPSVFNLLKSRGATVGTPGLVSVNDEIGRLQFRASDGTNFIAAAAVRAQVDATAAGLSMPGRLNFWTTPSGSTVPLERMRIDSAGRIGINTTSINAAAQLDVTSTTGGFLPPRMTAVQRQAIASPPAGLEIFDTTTNEKLAYNGTEWRVIGGTSTEIVGTAAVTTTSGTYSTITGATNTPAAGTYKVEFDAYGGNSANGNCDVALHVAATEDVSTRRNIGNTSSFGTVTVDGSFSFHRTITVNGSQVVDVRLRRLTAGTCSVDSRVFTLTPVARP